MRILVAADIHGDMGGVEKARRYAVDNEIDTILLLGDFPAYGDLRDEERNLGWSSRVLDELSDFRLMAIPGNCDSLGVIEEFDKRGINLHERIEIFKETSIAGFGGASPTPFNTPFEMSDDEVYRRLRDLMQKIETVNTILAVHQPPNGTRCDLTTAGMHAGSLAVRRIIEEYQPNLVVCSHIHEAGGEKEVMGESNVVNVGPVSQNRVGVIHITDEITIELEEI